MLATVGAMPSLESHNIKEVGNEFPTWPTYKVEDSSVFLVSTEVEQPVRVVIIMQPARSRPVTRVPLFLLISRLVTFRNRILKLLSESIL